MSKPDTTPKSEIEWCVHRAKMSASIGRDALSGYVASPKNSSPTEYAIYTGLQAIAEIAGALLAISRQIDELKSKKQ